MRKQLFGLALFLSIVVSTVLIYRLFEPQLIPVVPAVDYPNDNHAYLGHGNRFARKITTTVSAAEFDIKDRILKARIDLDWDGKNQPPKSFFLTFHLMTANGGRTIFADKTVLLHDVFSEGDRSVVTVTMNDVALEFAHSENIYTYVEVSANGQTMSSPETRFQLGRLTPVLLLHGSNAVRAEAPRSFK